MSIRAQQDYTFVSKYARYNKELKRRETYTEAVNRMRNMHLVKYAGKGIDDEINWAFDQVLDKRCLGSQRALQFGGEPILKKNERMFNCLEESTEFITSEGVRSFCNFNDGDDVVVLTHLGNWKNAKIKCYGKQILYKIKITRGMAEHTIRATRNHRWILDSGVFTDKLEVGDKLKFAPNIFSEFEYESASIGERIYWAYGFIFGDGTLVSDKNGEYKHSMVRLCGNDVKYKCRFEELGFKTSTNNSLNGDFFAYTGTYLKTTPDPKIDSPELIRAFVRGYLDADGAKNRSNNDKYERINDFISIQATGEKSINFIRECFPIAGIYIVSEKDYTGQKTNFGIRGKTISFRVINGRGKTANKFNVSSIEEDSVENVWCLEVEDDLSFVLPFALPTGNCCSSYCDRVRFFQEAFFLLLCGCGTGFSVQKHHIKKLGNLVKVDKRRKKEFIISDTIEGWADALGVLVSSYIKDGTFTEYEGCFVEFNYSKIRPEGAPLSSSSGKAPGPKALNNALEKIRLVFEERINGKEIYLSDGTKRIVNKSSEDEEFKDKIRPIDAYDIVMHASDAVLSGGVRRSSAICLFSPDDEEMANAKIGNWRSENPQRGRSNNSVILLRDDVSLKDFRKFIENTKQFGEPGFIFSDSTEQMVNPCFHKDTRLATKNGIIKIYDLYNGGKENEVVVDNRIGKENELFLEDKGTTLKNATRVHLTQKNADVYEVKTKHGYSLKCTLNHELPTLKGRKKVEELKIGDKIFLQSGEGCWGSVGNYEQGLILGLITGDGTFSNECNGCAYIDVWESDFDQIDYIKTIVNSEISKLKSISVGGRLYNENDWCDQNTGFSEIDKKRIGGSRLHRVLKENLNIENPKSIKKEIPECVWLGSREFVIGYLHGFFFSDGSVQYTERGNLKSTLSIRLGQSNEKMLMDVQMLLQNFGISSNYYLRREKGNYLLPDGKGGKKEYYTKTSYELIINRPNSIKFKDLIGLFGRKKDLLDLYFKLRGTSCNKPERHIAVIKSIEYFSTEDVFCLTQDETNSVIANGIVSSQCGEIGMYPVDVETGKSGWQMCNLTTMNGKKIKSIEDFELATKAASIIATLQAGYDEFPYMGELTEKIVKKEALIGVSITGIMDNEEIILNSDNLKKMAKLVLKINEEISNKIGVNLAARSCCLKPEGSGSLVVGSSSGIHPQHYKNYFRRQMANKNEKPLQFFKAVNPLAVEECKWSENRTDEVITFCIIVPDGVKTKVSISAIELLENVKNVQKNWVLEGMRPELCTQPWLTHNVSNTIHVKDDEWEDVIKYIYQNRKYFCGVSLTSITADLDYPQAPNCAIHTPRELVREYGDGMPMASGLIVDGLRVFDDLWEACDYLVIEDKKLKEPIRDEFKSNRAFERSHDLFEEQEDWLRRVVQFSDRYLEGNIKKTTYLLKEVHNWKLWCDLLREYKTVDYTQMIEEEDNTKLIEEVACSGGKCEI